MIDWSLPSLNPYKGRLLRAQTIEDIAQIAKERTPEVVFDYVEGGAVDEIAYARTRNAFTRIEFNTRVMRDVSKIDTSEKILGKAVDIPICFAPTGYTRLMHHVGEPAVANVASKKNLIYALSTMGTTSPAELAEAVPNSRRWFQLYIMKNRSDSLAVIKQAKDNGFEALVLTVDTPVPGLRYRDNRNGLTVPPKIRINTVLAIARKPIWWLNLFTTGKLEFAAFRGWDKPLSELGGLIFDPSTTMKEITWLRSVWKGPIVVKGVQSVEDAKAIAKLGVQGIILSNHGGRQFDRGQVPLEILPEVVKAVGNKVEIYIDGGIMSGLDALGAIALGAKAVFIGRAYLYGAMANGEAGVEQVIEIMRREFENGMALSGATNIAEVRKNGARIRN
ncbi:lactate dehydrogenase [freshwater metagenome]|uniref:Lactate dehydrogenase n=1 Tax=freshwater metagenome TaxID=449393 RepID=A0A094QGX9_9ZZZZ